MNRVDPKAPTDGQMKTTLPERSLEMWVAAYLVGRFPRITLWAPTQLAQPNFDMSAYANGKLFVFEAKAAYVDDKQGVPNGSHVVKIKRSQVIGYKSDPVLAACTYYLLPSPPYSTTAPTERHLPAVARARQGDASMGWQPVEQWAWTVPLGTLASGLGGSGASRQMRCDLVASHFGPDARTLKQFVDALKKCNVGARVESGQIQGTGGDQISIRDFPKRLGPRRPTATAAFVPATDIPGWG
jgi:hypothetical protein